MPNRREDRGWQLDPPIMPASPRLAACYEVTDLDLYRLIILVLAWLSAT